MIVDCLYSFGVFEISATSICSKAAEWISKLLLNAVKHFIKKIEHELVLSVGVSVTHQQTSLGGCFSHDLP